MADLVSSVEQCCSRNGINRLLFVSFFPQHSISRFHPIIFHFKGDPIGDLPFVSRLDEG